MISFLKIGRTSAGRASAEGPATAGAGSESGSLRRTDIEKSGV